MCKRASKTAITIHWDLPLERVRDLHEELPVGFLEAVQIGQLAKSRFPPSELADG